MPHADPSTHSAAHVVAEFLAAIVLIAAGLIILGLLARRRRLGRTSGVVLGATTDPARSLRTALSVTAVGLALASIVLATAPLLRPREAGPQVPDTVAVVLGIMFALVAVGLLAAARFGLGGLTPARLLGLRTAVSVAAVPLVGVAFLAAVVALAVPNGSVATP